jgi:uncharacterized protein YpmB
MNRREYLTFLGGNNLGEKVVFFVFLKEKIYSQLAKDGSNEAERACLSFKERKEEVVFR